MADADLIPDAVILNSLALRFWHLDVKEVAAWNFGARSKCGAKIWSDDSFSRHTVFLIPELKIGKSRCMLLLMLVLMSRNCKHYSYKGNWCVIASGFPGC